jgi:phage-related protein
MDRSDGVYYLRATIAGIGDVYANLFVPAYLRAQIDGSGDVSAGLVVGAILHARIDGSGDIWAWLSGGNTVTRTITFTGTLAAGESVVIDGLTFSILNDGDNAIGDFAGDFPMIFPGVNLLKYTDGEASRTVHITVVQPGAPATAETAGSLTLTYSGTLAAGKTLVIDGSSLTVENDGTNDMAHFVGDFPRIFPGANTIIYTDSAGSRTMKIAVIREERSA